jgi:hypothetical protein
MLIRKIFSFATLTLIVALTLSAIAAWYSILGLTAIFAAAVIPIIIMGGALEIAKVVTTLWLHKYWDRAGWNLKLYLIPAVMALAFLTSMGIFGFLSKAHSDQTLVSGDVGAKVELIDEKIKIARENIAMNQKALEQMNSQVDQLLGRTADDAGANRAVQVRRQQRAERTRLQNEISAEQEIIAKLNEEAAPVRAEIRKVEAEVGPIKYIAAMIYGDDPDNNLLERAVRWVIILIVFVFDPLALVLVLAAQSSYRWLDDDLRNRKKDTEDDTKEEAEVAELSEEHLGDILNSTEYVEPTQENDYVPEFIQPAIIETDGPIREDVHEAPIPDAASSMDGVDTEETTTDEPIRAERLSTSNIIKTEGVTIQEADGGYVKYQGRSISKAALQEMHPELFLQVDSGNSVSTSFGTNFPKFAKKGDAFVRVDTLPNRVFKFSGDKWIEINKNTANSYLYDEEYIAYLVSKIESGEYDVDLLSDAEKEQIEEYLVNHKSSN